MCYVYFIIVIVKQIRKQNATSTIGLLHNGYHSYFCNF